MLMGSLSKIEKGAGLIIPNSGDGILSNITRAMNYMAETRILREEIQQMNKQAELIHLAIDKKLAGQVVIIKNIHTQYSERQEFLEVEREKVNDSIDESEELLQTVVQSMVNADSPEDISLFSQQYQVVLDCLDTDYRLRHIFYNDMLHTLEKLISILDDNKIKQLGGN